MKELVGFVSVIAIALVTNYTIVSGIKSTLGESDLTKKLGIFACFFVGILIGKIGRKIFQD